ncbi:MAG: hypothetical protein JWM34_3161 [Ilumatobacteraceae bacterium]|nr:hypothetical protein [Ilumatobacteraceae bacterium]
MAAQAQFTSSDVTVQPGATETLTLTLVNLGSRTETFTLVPAGLVAGWVRLSPPTVSLFGGTHAEIQVTLRPPALPSTPAGPAPLTVRIIPQDDPDEVVIAETTVIIGAFHDRRVHLLQPVVRSRRRATFEFLVENQGNSQATCRLHLVDTSQRLDGDFDPPAIGIEPGGTSLVRLRMKAVRRQWRRGSRTVPFEIEADQPGFPTAVARATFVQTPLVPERLGRRLVALVVLAAALGGAWFGLIRPAMRREAKSAVRDYSPTVVLATTVVGATTNGGGTPTQETVASTVPPTTVPDPGVPFSLPLRVDADPNATVPATYTVEAGKELRLTDFILQNVNDDSGRATVLKNDVVITQWNLSTAYANNDPLQFVSPVVFEAGSTLTFQLHCDGVGAAGAGKCSDGLLVSGTLYESTTPATDATASTAPVTTG